MPTLKSLAMNWAASAVHYYFFMVPAVCVYAIWNICGPIPASVYLSGAAIHFFFVVLFPGSEEERSTPILIKKPDVFTKKRVLVIGAGPVGAVTVKELFENGHDVTCFDSAGRIGGTFANWFWPGGRLTSSPYVTCFSDYEAPRARDGGEQWAHVTAETYVTYLNNYLKHYGCHDRVQLKHKVLYVSEDEMGKIHAKVQDTMTGETRMEGPFDHMACCSGAFHTTLKPQYPGIDTFPGQLVHSRDFAASTTETSQDEAFKVVAGKRVLSIGLGESMADILGIIACKISNPTTYCACAVRKGALIVPRHVPGTTKIADLYTTRMRHALPKPVRNRAIWLNFKTFERTDKKAIAMFDLIDKLPGRIPGVTYVKSTKSGMFLPAIEQGKLDIKPALDRIEGRTAYFKDGSMVEDLDVIIYGTGYDYPKFPFFDENSFTDVRTGEKIMDVNSFPVDRLFRMIDPRLGTKCVFLGLGVRPLIGSIPTSAEMQARIFALLVGGKLEMPSNAIVQDRIDTLKAFNKSESEPYISQWQLYVNWIPFMDMLAREIGCIPSNWWLFTQPWLFIKLLWGPVTTYTFRLVGPGAKPKLAKDVIYRLPLDTGFRDNWYFSSIHFTLSFFKWPRATIQTVLGWFQSPPKDDMMDMKKKEMMMAKEKMMDKKMM